MSEPSMFSVRFIIDLVSIAAQAFLLVGFVRGLWSGSRAASRAAY